MQLRTGNSQKTKLETFKQTGTQLQGNFFFPVQVFFSLPPKCRCKVKVKGISWPPKPDIILVSRFLPESLIWPQILSEIGPKWIRQSLICNMCGRIFPRVANFKKNTRRVSFWATHNEFTIFQLFLANISFISASYPKIAAKKWWKQKFWQMESLCWLDLGTSQLSHLDCSQEGVLGDPCIYRVSSPGSCHAR